MIFVRLFIEFLKVGLFAVGGGLATLPFLYEMSAKTGWFTNSDISNLIAVSESTPGPMGINMATYTGFTTGGILGSIIAPLGLIVPSIIIIIIVAQFLNRFKENKTVQSTFYGLRPASTALIAVAGIEVVKIALFRLENLNISFKDIFFWKGIILAVVIYFGVKKFKMHPVVYIAISAVIGIVLKF